MAAPSFEIDEDIGQLRYRDLLARGALADLVILTKETP
jgi:hypothetical protein